MEQQEWIRRATLQQQATIATTAIGPMASSPLLTNVTGSTPTTTMTTTTIPNATGGGSSSSNSTSPIRNSTTTMTPVSIRGKKTRGSRSREWVASSSTATTTNNNNNGTIPSSVVHPHVSVATAHRDITILIQQEQQNAQRTERSAQRCEQQVILDQAMLQFVREQRQELLTAFQSLVGKESVSRSLPSATTTTTTGRSTAHDNQSYTSKASDDENDNHGNDEEYDDDEEEEDDTNPLEPNRTHSVLCQVRGARWLCDMADGLPDHQAVERPTTTPMEWMGQSHLADAILSESVQQQQQQRAWNDTTRSILQSMDDKILHYRQQMQEDQREAGRLHREAQIMANQADSFKFMLKQMHQLETRMRHYSWGAVMVALPPLVFFAVHAIPLTYSVFLQDIREWARQQIFSSPTEMYRLGWYIILHGLIGLVMLTWLHEHVTQFKLFAYTTRAAIILYGGAVVATLQTVLLHAIPEWYCRNTSYSLDRGSIVQHTLLRIVLLIPFMAMEFWFFWISPLRGLLLLVANNAAGGVVAISIHALLGVGLLVYYSLPMPDHASHVNSSPPPTGDDCDSSIMKTIGEETPLCVTSRGVDPKKDKQQQQQHRSYYYYYSALDWEQELTRLVLLFDILMVFILIVILEISFDAILSSSSWIGIGGVSLVCLVLLWAVVCLSHHHRHHLLLVGDTITTGLVDRGGNHQYHNQTNTSDDGISDRHPPPFIYI